MCVVLGQRLAEGFRSLLGWFKSEYGNPPLLVTENGRPDDNVYFDTDRIQFHHVRPTILLQLFIRAFHLDSLALY